MLRRRACDAGRVRAPATDPFWQLLAEFVLAGEPAVGVALIESGRNGPT
jgi:hypothetical protein